MATISHDEIAGMVNIELQTLNKLLEDIKKLTPLYNQGLINKKGPRKGKRYTEIIAEELLRPDNIKVLRRLPLVNRISSYNMEHEKPSIGMLPERFTQEKWTAKFLFGEKLGDLGEVIDYQTPLKNVQKDTSGEIDLLSYNANSNIIYIIELKKSGSTETLLRCVLEIYTYSKQVNRVKLLNDFGKPDATLRKAVLVFKNSQAYRDFQPEDSEIRKLMKKLGVDFFVLNETVKYICDKDKHDTVMKLIGDDKPIVFRCLHEEL